MSSTTASSSASASAAAAAETVVGSHVLTIDGYSKTKAALGVGDSVKSEKFLVGGHSWYIDCYPCGEDEEAAGWVSVFICLDLQHYDGEVMARGKFVLVDRQGETLREAETLHDHVLTFSSTHNSIGLEKLINITELESCLHKDNVDYFQIRIDLTVIREHPAAVQLLPGDLRLGDVLAKQEEGRDVTFEVGGELFTAHRCVLAARSPVFMAELFRPGMDQNTATAAHVRIDCMEPRVFRTLLHFIYTDSLPDEVVNEGDDNKVAIAQGLLAAADRYRLERLKMVCSDMLGSYIAEATAVTTLQLAHKHGCHKLKEAYSKFLKDVLANADLL